MSLRYLVLGRTGFAATHIVQALEEVGHNVSRWGARRCEEDLRDTVDLAKFVVSPGGPFDVVVNCVGDARMFHAEKHPAESLRDNVLTAINVVQALEGLPVKPRLVHVSSCMAAEPENVYGLHKRLAEEHVMLYSGDKTVVRPGALFGPGMKKGPVYDAMVAVRDGSGEMWLDPDASVPLTNVHQLTRLVLREDEVAAEYPFGYGADLTGCIGCRQIVRLVAEAAQRPVPEVQYKNGFIPHPFSPRKISGEEFLETWKWFAAGPL